MQWVKQKKTTNFVNNNYFYHRQGSRQQGAQRATGSDGNVPSSYPNPLPPPAAAGFGEPSLSSLQVRREKEQELRANDVYWTKRLQTLEANLQKTNQILEKEYNDAVSLNL